MLKKCVEKFKSKSKNFTDFNDSDFSPIHELNSKNEEISINFIENENKKVVKEDLINIQEKQIKQKANEEKIKVNIGEQIAKNIQIQKQTSLNKIELFQNNQSKGKMSIILIEPDDKDPKKAWNQNDILENYESNRKILFWIFKLIIDNDKFKNRIEPKKQVLDFFNHFIFKFKGLCSNLILKF